MQDPDQILAQSQQLHQTRISASLMGRGQACPFPVSPQGADDVFWGFPGTAKPLLGGSGFRDPTGDVLKPVAL